MINELYHYLSQQATRIQQLEQALSKLQKEFREMKDKPTTNIDRIEYKFDQLKIETLEGTLNIGLNPSDLNAIDDFSVQNQTMNSPIQNIDQQQAQMRIQEEIHRYLDGDCFQFIENLNKNNKRTIDDTYYQYIVEDIRRQINHRITYYINQYATQLTGDEKEKYQEQIIEKVKDDIHKSLIAFIENLPNHLKGGIHDEFHSD